MRETFSLSQNTAQCRKAQPIRIAHRRPVHALYSIPKKDLSNLSRREQLQAATLLLLTTHSLPVHALGFKKDIKRRKVGEDEYQELPENPLLRYYDLEVGTGRDIVKPGTLVTVHFDCLFKGIDVVSSRSARLLGGNRSIAEPFELTAGDPSASGGPNNVSMVDTANGLFSGQGGPRPPVALAYAVVGMRVGGKRSVLVPPELGYGEKGEQEIGPNTPFELKIELLSAR